MLSKFGKERQRGNTIAVRKSECDSGTAIMVMWVFFTPVEGSNIFYMPLHPIQSTP